MNFIIITGMSGSGKTNALKILEDIGYDCIDNLPVELLPKFIEFSERYDRQNRHFVLGMDIRAGDSLASMEEILDDMREKKISYKVLFLDASDETLIKRYKETRRSHPLGKNDRIEVGIQKERKKLDFLKKRADYVIDTGNLLTKDLRKELINIFQDDKEYDNLHLDILSFGFVYGIPKDTDLLFDVRFLPNPFYIPHMRMRTGEEEDVRDYVFSDGNAEVFVKKLEEILDFLFPLYIKEGRKQLVIAIGCTGGQHRSVAIANEIGIYMTKHINIGCKVEHRDAEKNVKKISQRNK